MKQTLRIFLVPLALLAVALIVYAASPTVTTTTSYYDRATLYSFSFGTNISNVDTAFIYSTAGGAFSFQDMGMIPQSPDTMLTIELWTTEATADSVRFAVFLQGTSKVSPNVTERSMTGSNQDWITIAVDSASFNNSGNATTPKLLKFGKSRLSGLIPKGRLVIAEIGTVAKDANQTIRGRLLIPKYRRL